MMIAFKNKNIENLKEILKKIRCNKQKKESKKKFERIPVVMIAFR